MLCTAQITNDTFNDPENKESVRKHHTRPKYIFIYVYRQKSTQSSTFLMSDTLRLLFSWKLNKCEIFCCNKYGLPGFVNAPHFVLQHNNCALCEIF